MHHRWVVKMRGDLANPPQCCPWRNLHTIAHSGVASTKMIIKQPQSAINHLKNHSRLKAKSQQHRCRRVSTSCWAFRSRSRKNRKISTRRRRRSSNYYFWKKMKTATKRKCVKHTILKWKRSRLRRCTRLIRACFTSSKERTIKRMKYPNQEIATLLRARVIIKWALITFENLV